MRQTLRVPLLAILLAGASSLPARGDGSPGSFEIWVTSGFATQSLKDWNDRNSFVQSGLDFFGFPGNYHGFGNAIPVGAEVGYRVTNRLTVGAGARRQTALADNTLIDPIGIFFGAPGRADERIDMTLTTAFAVVGYRITNGITAWANFGYGTTDVSIQSALTFDANPSQAFASRLEYDGSGLVGGINLGLQRELGGRAMVRTTVGFQMANMGELSGPGGPPTSFNGETIQTDFGGLHLSVGVGAVLNKVR